MMMNRLIQFLSAGWLLAAGADIAQADWRELYEPLERKGMPCRVMKPINFDPGKNYPVIVSLHGAGGKGSDNRKQLKDWNRQIDIAFLFCPERISHWGFQLR